MDEPKLQEILDDAAERLALGRYSNADASVHALVAEVRRLTAALATARREGAEEMRERCDFIASKCARERRSMLARWDAEGVRPNDERRMWVVCKASEAERIRDAIRALPLDGDGGAT